MDFGREVRRRRQAARISVETLAEAAGLSPNFVRAVELGRSDPSLSSVLALCRGLRVAPADLFGGIKGIGPLGIEAGQLLDAAAPDVQDAVLRLLRVVSRRRR